MKKKLTLTFLFFIIGVTAVFASPGPGACDGTDPDANCPIDTWVVVFAIATLLFTTFHLYRKQKNATVLV